MLQRKYRLRKKSGFQAIFQEGKNYSAKYVAIYVHKGLHNGMMKFGFIASKKVGNSVQRNRARRLMREVIRLHLSEIKNSVQIIFIARVSIKGVSYIEVEKNILMLLNKANVLRKSE